MRFSGKIFLVAAGVFLAVGAGWAQEVNDREVEVTAEEMAAALDAELGLTDEQVREITPIFEYHLEQRKILYRKERQGANKKKLRARVRELRQEVETRLARHISPEQLAKRNAGKPAAASTDALNPAS